MSFFANENNKKEHSLWVEKYRPNTLNGYVFREGDINALTESLKSIVNDTILREKMGEASKEKINQFSHQVTSQNIRSEL